MCRPFTKYGLLVQYVPFVKYGLLAQNEHWSTRDPWHSVETLTLYMEPWLSIHPWPRKDLAQGGQWFTRDLWHNVETLTLCMDA